jgi:hypothetical protein
MPFAVVSTPADDAPPRAYVETTHIVAPKHVGGFSLKRSSFDPQTKYSGAGFTYRSDEAPHPTISVFVYPAGRMVQADAVREGMIAFREDLRLAEEAGTYSDLQILTAGAFPLSGSDEATASAGGSSPDAELLATIANAGRIDGERLQLRLRLPGRDGEIQSAGFLFYKQLYYFKVRVSADGTSMPGETFLAFADSAARTLVPAIDAVNIGDCAKATINIPVGGSAEDGARVLVREATLQQGYNCHADREAAKLDALARDAEVVEIGYRAEEWRSQ